MRTHIVIIGGGITGLSTAYYLERFSAERNVPIEITLVEQAGRLGGKLGTDLHDDLLVDTGPDSFMAQKPWAVELCRELGIDHEIIAPLSSQFYMLFHGKLHAVPHELVSLVPTKPEALWKTSFLSLAGKTRASGEGLIKQRGDVEDESLSSFMRRRFGDEFASHFAEPLMGGVHAGNPEQMSMAAIYPTFWEMEAKHGSITRAILERRLAAGAHPPRSGSPFVALRHGMQRLVDAVQTSLQRTRILLNTGITGLSAKGDGAYQLSLSDGDTLHADGIVLTTPAFTAADLLMSLSQEAANLLGSIPYASTAVVTLAYRRETIQDPLEGTGFLVPRDQPLAITGCTWSSNKWEGRAPEGTVLMRAFMGYAGNDALVLNGTEEDLAREAHGAIAQVLGAQAPPLFTRVDRYLHAMPQYEVGHIGKIRQIERALSPYPGLLLAGAAYRGVGIPDCVRQGKESAEQLVMACAERLSPALATAGNHAS